MSFLANINKVALIAVFVLLGGAGGFLWWKQMYTPAQAGLSAADARLQQANQLVETKREELRQVESKGVDRADQATIIAARAAIPKHQQSAELGMQLEDAARRAGVTLKDVNFQTNSGLSAEDSSGPQPITVTVSGHGTYGGMVLYLQALQEMVETHRGKVYVRGRLVNIESLEIKTDEGAETGGGISGGALAEDSIPPNHRNFTITLTTYAEILDGSGSSEGAGGGSSDAGAAGGDAGGAAGTGGTGTGGAGTTGDPGAAGSGTAGTSGQEGGGGEASSPSTTSVPPGTS